MEGHFSRYGSRYAGRNPPHASQNPTRCSVKTYFQKVFRLPANFSWNREFQTQVPSARRPKLEPPPPQKRVQAKHKIPDKLPPSQCRLYGAAHSQHLPAAEVPAAHVPGAVPTPRLLSPIVSWVCLKNLVSRSSRGPGETPPPHFPAAVAPATHSKCPAVLLT